MVKNFLRLLSVSDRHRRRLHQSHVAPLSTTGIISGASAGAPPPVCQSGAVTPSSCTPPAGGSCPSLGARWTLTRLHALAGRILARRSWYKKKKKIFISVGLEVRYHAGCSQMVLSFVCLLTVFKLCLFVYCRPTSQRPILLDFQSYKL